MTPPATNEERQAAKDEVRKWYSPFVDDEWLACFCEKELSFASQAIRTEARNAALEAQVKEARELLHCADWNEEMEHAMSQNEWDKRFIKLSRETK